MLMKELHIDNYGNQFDGATLDADDKGGPEYCWAYVCAVDEALLQGQGATMFSTGTGEAFTCGARDCQSANASTIYYLWDERAGVQRPDVWRIEGGRLDIAPAAALQALMQYGKFGYKREYHDYARPGELLGTAIHKLSPNAVQDTVFTLLQENNFHTELAILKAVLWRQREGVPKLLAGLDRLSGDWKVKLKPHEALAFARAVDDAHLIRFVCAIEEVVPLADYGLLNGQPNPNNGQPFHTYVVGREGDGRVVYLKVNRLNYLHLTPSGNPETFMNWTSLVNLIDRAAGDFEPDERDRQMTSASDPETTFRFWWR
jgi:hypothetical protein